MKIFVAFALLLVVPALNGQMTRTRSGVRPRRLMPPAAPPAGGFAPPPPGAGGMPPRRRNDIKDVPDNSRFGAPPPPPVAGFMPPAAPPAGMMGPPPAVPAYNVVPPANIPPTRTRSMGMLRPRPPPIFDQFVPVMPTTMFPTSTQGWRTYDTPDVKKEEEESR